MKYKCDFIFFHIRTSAVYAIVSFKIRVSQTAILFQLMQNLNKSFPFNFNLNSTKIIKLSEIHCSYVIPISVNGNFTWLIENSIDVNRNVIFRKENLF